MADRLEALLERFSVRAQLFHSGTLCGINDLAPEADTGQLHLIKQGEVTIGNAGMADVRVTRPSVLLYPRPLAHRFVMDATTGADLACANLRFEGGSSNPIAVALPAFICIPLDQLTGSGDVLALIFEEAFEERCGRRALLDRLFEVVLIQILRHLMDSTQTQIGMLAGLAHPKLRLAIIAMHEQPAKEWGLDALAATAGMSRSVFANVFRETVGCTPGVYLQRWRVSLVQQALRQGRPLKLIADEVGYGSESALSRSFKASCGVSPREWKQAH
ncbi:MAG: AraC family transcriptional regulator [Pseudomonas sp.]|nr:AraC family transcriptional regulator [Pseudomonas sp.]